MNNVQAQYKVLIDNTDVSHLVTSVGDTYTALDIDRPTEFNVSNVALVINNSTQEWSPSNPNNRFIGLGYNKKGFGAKITVYADDEIIFLGQIFNTTENPKTRLLRIDVQDPSSKLRSDTITDFGIQKRLVLQKGVEQSNHGSYPFPGGVTPISEDSFIGSSGNVSLVERDSILSEGSLSPFNVQITDTELQSEGGILPQNPSISIKTAYRNKRTSFILNEVFKKYSIDLTNIRIENLQLANNTLHTLGRVGYDIEAIGEEHQYTMWTGYTTDYIKLGDRFYFLYSSRAPNSRPRLLQYDEPTDTWSVLYTRDAFAEWWGLAAQDEDTFFILGTTGESDPFAPTLGVYDPTENNPATFIERVTRAGNKSDWITPDATLRPVVGMYYMKGFNFSESDRIGIRPDTRHSFMYHNNRLYYRYANRLSCGVACSATAGNATAVAIIPRDNIWNHLGFDFDIEGSDMVIGATWQKGTTSTRSFVKRNI